MVKQILVLNMDMHSEELRNMYRKASFRGIEFEVTERSYASGRRNQIHEYPNKNIGYTEDLGLKVPSYPVTAFVIGTDYLSKRGALQKSCIQDGSGTLIHPDYGTIEVICDSITIKESHSQQKLAIFELIFIEAGEKAIPETSVDLSESVLLSSSKMTEASKDSFASSFSLSEGVAGLTSLIGGISGTCSSAIDNIGTGVGYATGLSDNVTGSMNKLVGAASSALALKTSIKSFLNTPSALASQFDSVFSIITSLSGNSTNSFQTVRGLASKSNASTTASTSNADARAEKIGMQQIEQLTKQIVVAKEAEIITAIDFESSDDAEIVLEDFLNDAEEVEVFEDVEPSLEIIQNLRDLRENVVKYVQEIIIKLPKIKTIKLPEKTPSLVLAYELYEDLSRSDEIVKRNKIPFPAFVPAGKDLKVLSE